MDIQEYHDVWVFAEQRDNALMPVVIELLGEGRRLADEIGCRLGVIVCGENIDQIVYELGLLRRGYHLCGGCAGS